MTAHIDIAAIEKFRRDYDDADGTLLAQIVEAFFDEIRIFQEASRASAVAQLARAAHRLKSVAATLGASQVVELCRRLETAAVNDRSTDAADILGQLLPALVRARVSLKRIVDSSSGAPST